jgi:hypothetical protein
MLFELHADTRQLPFEDDSPPQPAGRTSLRSLPTQAVAARSGSSEEESVEGYVGKLTTEETEARVSIGTMASILEAKDDFPLNQGEDRAVALLVASLVKGRVPLEDGEEPNKYSLRISVCEESSDERPFSARDTEFWKYVQLSETTTNTIEELSSAGFPADRIASMLKLDKELVSKVMAFRLRFNMSLASHLSVFVPKFGLTEDSSLTVEVVRRKSGYVKARGQLLLSKVWNSNGMKLRSLVHLTDTERGEELEERTDEKTHYDLDMEIRLFAFVPQTSRKAT